MRLTNILPYLLAFYCYFFYLPNTSAQPGCNDPIVFNGDINVMATTGCLNATGTIIITMENLNLFTFVWSHDSTINTSIADNLATGLYNIKIIRISNPACFIDTNVIVPVASGFNIPSSVTPDTCMAAKGKIEMFNSSYIYNWGIHGTGQKKENLIAGNYLVTVTDTMIDCTTVLNIEVPNNNPLHLSVNVVQHAKCGRNNGIAIVTVTGGSGNYSYSLGDSDTLTKLGAGVNLLKVIDNSPPGCEREISFDVYSLEISGTIQKTTKDVTCAGRSDGKLTVNVVPGGNFKMPFDFAIRDVSGFEKDPNALPIGKYYLYVVDADSCALPVDSFNIQNPNPIVVQAMAKSSTCDSLGAISLALSGGLGTLRVDWDDLNGSNQPTNRFGLEAGIYSGFVYDSFFCIQVFPDITITSNCNRNQYLHEVVQANTFNIFCLDALPGVPDTSITLALAFGSADGQSNFGTWTMNNNNGCLSYTAGPQTGYAVDTVCIIRSVPSLNLADTTCYVISIVQQPPSNQYINFTLQPNSVALACGNIPAGFDHFVITQLSEPGFTGLSGFYGAYSINPLTGCLDFTSNEYIGNNVDDIMVLVYDTILNLSRVFHYIPSILSDEGCIGNLELAENYTGETLDCDGTGTVCLPLPYARFTNYSVFDNGIPYTQSSAGCNTGTFINYVVTLPAGGPYTISEWIINGQNFSGGNFSDIYGLASFMDLLDVSASWEVQFGAFVVGGNTAVNTYGKLKIQPVQGALIEIMPTQLQVDQGSTLKFSAGTHTVIFRDNINGCIDTTNVFIKCLECPPVHSNIADPDGVIRREICDCTQEDIFCTDIPTMNAGQYDITKEGLPFTNIFSCADKIGFRVGVGLHHFVVRDVANECNDTIIFELKCQSIDVAYTEFITIQAGQQETICLDTSILSGVVNSVTRVCENNGNVGWQLLPNWCVVLTGQAVGLDTFCFQMCHDACDCAIVNIQVNVLAPEPTDAIYAIEDRVFTPLNVPVPISIFKNDTINGILGNFAGIDQVLFLSYSNFGELAYNNTSGVVTYTPDEDRCGIDSFEYSIQNAKGIADTATVVIQVACKKVLVFNGLSPNGDQLNDVWHIIGIDQYPQNEIKVFNRWGNLVFSENGYKNDKPWNGTWNGKDLPDGTYFYMIDLNDGEDQLSGYMELRR